MTNAIGPRDMTRIAKALEGIVRELRRMQEPTCRVHGKWNDDCACSVCGCQPWYEHDIYTLNFCPNCGADMREKAN